MNTLSEQPNTSFKLAIVIAVIHSFFDTLLDDGMRLNLTTSLSSLQKKKNYLQFFEGRNFDGSSRSMKST